MWKADSFNDQVPSKWQYLQTELSDMESNQITIQDA